MSHDDPGERRLRRAELEAQLRVARERRDQLQEQLAAKRASRAARPDEGAPRVSPAAMLPMIEQAMRTVQPMLAMLTAAREMLLAEQAEAERRGDDADVREASHFLGLLTEQLAEYHGVIAQLEGVVETLRARIAADDQA